MMKSLRILLPSFILLICVIIFLIKLYYDRKSYIRDKNTYEKYNSHSDKMYISEYVRIYKSYTKNEKFVSFFRYINILSYVSLIITTILLTSSTFIFSVISTDPYFNLDKYERRYAILNNWSDNQIIEYINKKRDEEYNKRVNEIENIIKYR